MASTWVIFIAPLASQQHAGELASIESSDEAYDLAVFVVASAGCGTTRRYGLSVFQPAGYVFFASSSDTDGRMMTSSPCFQLAGVATLCVAVSCIESRARRISSKLRP